MRNLKYVDPVTAIRRRGNTFTAAELRNLRAHWTEELCFQYQTWRELEVRRRAGKRYRRSSYYIRENAIKYAKQALWGLWNLTPIDQ